MTGQFVTTVSLAQQTQLPFLAAAIAYYAFLSVVPLLIVSFAVATVLAGETVATQILTTAGGFLTPEASDILTEALVAGPGREGVTAIGVVVLLWGSLRVFLGLDTAFSRIYGIVTPKSFVEQLRDATIVLLGIGLAIGATVAVSTIPLLFGASVPSILGPITLLLVLGLIFFPLYYVFPASDVTVREAVPGSLFAAGGWTVLSVLFGLYTSVAGGFQLYGVLGGVMLLLIWFYFGGAILLFGVALNAVIADRSGDRQLQQVSERQHTQRGIMGEAAGPTDGGHEPDDERTDHDETDEVTSPTADGTTTVDSTDRTSSAQRERTVVTRDELRDLEAKLDEFEDEIEDRTVHRKELERDLKGYVRARVRRGHATGWGPYLVLLYGTAMTLGAFYLLSGGWAILAMLVIWLSTLGLYVLMLLVGVVINGVGIPRRILDKVRSLR